MAHFETSTYRLLLRLLPAAVRHQFGADMAQMFRDRRQQVARHPVAIARLWLEAVADVAVQAARPGRSTLRFTAPVWTVEAFSNDSRSGWVTRQLDALRDDIRVGLRRLAHDRAFTAVAVSVLAIGICANAAAFGLVNALLLKPRPGHPTGAVLGLYNKDLAKPGLFHAFSYQEYLAIRQRTDVFTAVGAHNFTMVGIGDGDHMRKVIVDMVSRDYFDVFGAPLHLGRPFTADEERPGSGAKVAILSYAAWQKRGASPDVVGSTLTISGRPWTIVGVAEKGFGGSLALIAPEVWVPISAYDRLAGDLTREAVTTPLADRATRMLIIDVQLRPTVTLQSAAPALDALSAELVAADPVNIAHSQLLLAPLSRLSVSPSPHTDSELTVVTAALLSLSGIVLIIATIDLANMLLARGVARRKEIAIRLAIGGSRSRLVRQLLTEGLLLSVLGGAIGLCAAQWSTQLLGAELGPLLPVSLLLDPTPDVRVLAATTGFIVLSVLLFSLGPAWKLARTDAVPELKNQAGEVPARSRIGTRHLLVGGQLALSLVMLMAAGLFVESSLAAASANPGFPIDRGVIVEVDASLEGSPPAQTTQLYERLLRTLRARPEVAAASLGSNFPYSGISDDRGIRIAGRPVGDPHTTPAELVSIASDYFRTLDLPILQGRDFDTGSVMTNAKAHEAVIDVPLARHLFGAASPIGRQIEYDGVGQSPTQPPTVLDVIGLVPGIRGDAFDTDGHVYTPYGQDPRSAVYFHLKTSVPTAAAEVALLPMFRHAFLSVDPNLPILAVETRATYRDRDILLAIVRIAAQIFGVFGVAALILATAGIYGVKAYLVSRRTREIGIRVALGARTSSVVWLVVREGLTMALVGLGVGAGLSILAGIGLRSILVQADQPYLAVLTGSLGLLFTACLLAGLVPARRALRIQPVQALRTD